MTLLDVIELNREMMKMNKVVDSRSSDGPSHGLATGADCDPA